MQINSKIYARKEKGSVKMKDTQVFWGFNLWGWKSDRIPRSLKKYLVTFSIVLWMNRVEQVKNQSSNTQ